MNGEADTALANAIHAANYFAALLKQLEREKLPIFSGSQLKEQRRKVLDHSKKNLQYMNTVIASAPKTLLDMAKTKLVMDELKSRMR